MEREQLEQHKETLRRWRATIGPDTPTDRLALIVGSITEIVEGLIDERLAAGAHGGAVRELIRTSGEPRMTFADTRTASEVGDGSGSKVEPGGKLSPGEVDPRD